MIKIRKLKKEEKNKIIEFYNIIEKDLEDKNFWLPIKEKEEKEFFKDTSIFYGAFDNNKLVGLSSLFIDKNVFKDLIDEKDFNSNIKIGKITRMAVLKEYRGNNLVYKINLKLKEIAKKLNIKYLIAILHPDNIPSNKSFQKLGMQKEKFIIKDNIYPRNILKLNLY